MHSNEITIMIYICQEEHCIVALRAEMCDIIPRRTFFGGGVGFHTVGRYDQSHFQKCHQFKGGRRKKVHFSLCVQILD